MNKTIRLIIKNRSPPIYKQKMLEIGGKMKKRRKYKENPYVLNNDGEIYTIIFKDSKNKINQIVISKELYDVFDRFELDDLKELNEYDRHTEHLELTDEEIYKRSGKSYDVESNFENRNFSSSLSKAISSLSPVQKRRIVKYYFNDKNEYEIAKEEGTTHQAVNKSLIQARTKLKDILKN